MEKYNLTDAELKELKRRCELANIPFHSQAARPAQARKLLNDPRLDEIKLGPQPTPNDYRIFKGTMAEFFDIDDEGGFAN